MNETNVRLDDDLADALEAARAPSELDRRVNAILRAHLIARAKTDLGEQTDQLHSASRLRLLEETLESIVDAVITVDLHAVVDYMNPAAVELTGRLAEDCLGRSVAAIAELSAPDGNWVASDLVQRCLEQGTGVDVREDAILISRSGREVCVDGVASPLRNQSGNIVGAALVLRDVTARRRAESDLARQRRILEELVSRRTADLKALQDELLKKERLATLGHLTATVSHELRNPLGTIRTSMHVLEEQLRDVAPHVRPLFERIDRNILRCVGIISELLDFAQVRELHYERVDFDGWLGGVLDELGAPNGVKVERMFGFGASLDIDTERLRRAITNVFDNAIHAMLGTDGGGEHKLTVRTRAVTNKVELSFADTGPGMTEEVRAQVFRELFSTKRFGVGLGLPIVKQVLERHGGEVHVQSTLGAGTRVIMRLPIRSAASAGSGDDRLPAIDERTRGS